jgi:GTP-binding protein YchF
MRIAIIGLPTTGKSTVFRALTGQPGASAEEVVASIQVPDERVDRLSALYKPRKTTFASVEFVDLGAAAGLRKESSELGQRFLNAVRPAAALLHVLDAFSVPEAALEAAAEAIQIVDTELGLADLAQAEKRLERLRKEGTKTGPAKQEAELLERVQARLSQGERLRDDPELARAEALRSFAFLSAKPMLTVLNTAEGGGQELLEKLPAEIRSSRQGPFGRLLSLSAQLEAEIAALPPEDVAAFLNDFGIAAPARERVLREGYELLGLQSFFTVGEDEVRAWRVRRDAPAQEAAHAIHSDIARGFIKAEVVPWQTVLEHQGFEQARKAGKLRLEGKDYPVQDGDVINFRFNV